MEEMNHSEEIQEEYTPRPKWQVWGARVALVFMLISIALWLYNIAHPL